MIGQRFGRLVVQELHERRGYNKRFKCLCDCGKTKMVFAGNLRRGFTVSCGCYHAEVMTEISTTHGQSHNNKTSAYNVWTNMKKRCLNPKSKSYADYGGRGITVCERWLNSFGYFFEDMGPVPFKGAQIDRINNNGGYSPDNCKWSTSVENSRNKRNSVFLTFDGKTLTVAEWAGIVGIKVGILYQRLYRGMPVERVLTQRPRLWLAQRERDDDDSRMDLPPRLALPGSRDSVLQSEEDARC